MNEIEIVKKFLSNNGNEKIGLGMWILGFNALNETTINPTGQYINFIAETYVG